MILAYGSFQSPETRDEMTPVRAVRECDWKELVTYGVRVLMMPEEKARINATSQILVSVSECPDHCRMGAHIIYASIRSRFDQTCVIACTF